jgi:putative ABC transport system substrate-binding protein
VTTKVTSGAQSLAPVLETGRNLGFRVEPIHVHHPADLAKALSPEVLAGFDALVFVPDVVLNAHMAEVIQMVNQGNKPAIFPSPDWVANGGLMSFGPDVADGKAKASQCSSSSIAVPIMRSTFKIFRCQPSILDITLSSTN